MCSSRWPGRAISRREAVSRLALATAGALMACNEAGAPSPALPPIPGGGLASRPGPGGPPPAPGLHPLNLSLGYALLYVPPGLPNDAPVPLVLGLHGDPAVGHGNPDTANYAINWFRGLADAYGFVLLSPASKGPTWDAILHNAFGDDLAFIDQALATTFAMCRIDPERIGVAGFSDGATYTLALGLPNGDLFRRLVSLAPGGLLNVSRVGRPSVYLSHGTNDTKLPIEIGSRRIAPALERDGYEVIYREFFGGHVINAAHAREALRWVIGGALDATDP